MNASKQQTKSLFNYLRATALFYALCGLIMLAVPRVFPAIQNGNFLTSSQLWGYGFLVVAILMGYTILGWHVPLLRHLGLSALLGLTAGWLVIQVIAVVQFGFIDILSTLTWGYLFYNQYRVIALVCGAHPIYAIRSTIQHWFHHSHL